MRQHEPPRALMTDGAHCDRGCAWRWGRRSPVCVRRREELSGEGNRQAAWNSRAALDPAHPASCWLSGVMMDRQTR